MRRPLLLPGVYFFLRPFRLELPDRLAHRGPPFNILRAVVGFSLAAGSGRLDGSGRGWPSISLSSPALTVWALSEAGSGRACCFAPTFCLVCVCSAASFRALMISSRIFSTSTAERANRSAIRLTRAASSALTTMSHSPSGLRLSTTAAYRMPYFLASWAKARSSPCLMTNTWVGFPRKLRIRVLPLTRFTSLSAAIRNAARDTAAFPLRLATHSTPFTVTLVAMFTICSAASPVWLME